LAPGIFAAQRSKWYRSQQKAGKAVHVYLKTRALRTLS
jgi:hypothetical protein